MSVPNIARARIWHAAFGREPEEIPPSGFAAAWLARGAIAFATETFTHLTEEDTEEAGEEILEDLAGVLSAFEAPSPVSDEVFLTAVGIAPPGFVEKLRAAVRDGLWRLLNVSLGSVEEPEVAERRRAGQTRAVRAARSVLLRVKNGDQSSRRFPWWVQETLLDHAFEMIRDDVLAYTNGKRARARDLALMLAANYAAFRQPKQKARFINLLAQLCNRSEDYMDPFLRDLVLIAQRITRPEDVPEVVRLAPVERDNGEPQ